MIAMLYGAPLGTGGLGLQALNAVHDILSAGGIDRVVAMGPENHKSFQGQAFPPSVELLFAPRRIPWVPHRFSLLRWRHGRRQYLEDVERGRWAAKCLSKSSPACLYGFTQISLESLEWARRAGVPAVLDSPNGHIRSFREVYLRETNRWRGLVFLAHPTPAMVQRVEREYELATLIRVSSSWARDSLISRGVPPGKVVVVPQRPRFKRFHPPFIRREARGPLRVCFVGTLDMRKGFVYLLRAVRRLGPERVKLWLVGGTTDRFTASLLRRESMGLNIIAGPGDPLPALQWSEMFVLPTLEDGSPFVVLEAMAAGVPVLVTTECGSQEMIRQGENGWVIQPADEIALADALGKALENRERLPEMGLLARANWENLHCGDNAKAMRNLFVRAGVSLREENIKDGN